MCVWVNEGPRSHWDGKKLSLFSKSQGLAVKEERNSSRARKKCVSSSVPLFLCWNQKKLFLEPWFREEMRFMWWQMIQECSHYWTLMAISTKWTGGRSPKSNKSLKVIRGVHVREEHSVYVFPEQPWSKNFSSRKRWDKVSPSLVAFTTMSHQRLHAGETSWSWEVDLAVAAEDLLWVRCSSGCSGTYKVRQP